MLHKIHKNGATVIELMIYFSLFSILVGLIFPWIIQSHTISMLFGKKIQITIDAHCAADVLTHDIRHAPCSKKRWKNIHKDTLIWHMEDYDVGWYIKNNKLIRTQGIYNQETKTWAKHQSSVVLYTIQEILFDTFQKKENVTCVNYTLTLSQGERIQRSVYLNNRLIV